MYKMDCARRLILWAAALAAVVSLALLPSCKPKLISPSAKPLSPSGKPAAPAPKAAPAVDWLDATRKVEKKGSVESPIDTPIDRACFVGDGVVVAAWHQSQPSKVPVPEDVYLMDAATDTSTVVKFGKGEIPLRVIPSPGRKFAAVHTLAKVKMGAYGSVTADSNVMLIDADGKVRRLAVPVTMGLVGIPTDEDVIVGKINDLTFQDGAMVVSYGGERQYFLADKKTGRMTPTASGEGAYSPKGDRVLSADKFESSDKPTESLVQYNVMPLSAPEKKREVMKTPLYITYSEVDWAPVALWQDETHLLLSYFTPTNTKESKATPNLSGSFELDRYNILAGDKATVVTDAIPFLSVAVGPKGRFFVYNGLGEKDGTQTWHIWVSSADGSEKRMVWEEKGQIAFLVPEDVSPDGKEIALNMSVNTPEGYRSSVMVITLGAPGTASGAVATGEADKGASSGASTPGANQPAPKESTGFHEAKEPPKGKK